MTGLHPRQDFHCDAFMIVRDRSLPIRILPHDTPFEAVIKICDGVAAPVRGA
jgi:hypothetical protein